MTCAKLLILLSCSLWAIPLQWKTEKGRADFKWITTPWNATKALEGQLPQEQPHFFLRLSQRNLPEVFDTQMYSIEGGIPFAVGQWHFGYRVLTQDNLRAIDADGKETGTFSNDDQEWKTAWLHSIDSWKFYAQGHYLFSNLDTYSSHAFWFDAGASHQWNNHFTTHLQFKQMGAGSSLITREIVLPLQSFLGQDFNWQATPNLNLKSSLQHLYQNDFGHDAQFSQYLYWSDFASLQAAARLRDFYWGAGGGLHFPLLSLNYLYNSGELDGQHSFSVTLFL